MGRRKHHRAYGVIWDENTSTPTCERIGQGKSAAATTKLPDNLMALQSRMRSCLFSDAGAVQYYTHSTDRTKKEDGVTPSVLTGADGQVMVEILLGWLKYWYVGTEHHWLISKEQFNGAVRLDAFYKNGAWVDYRYIGAYEGTWWDAANGYQDSANDHTDQDGSGDVLDTVNDKLASVSGINPLTDETRAEFRLIAAKRGMGWRQQDYDLVSAIQLLYLTEYASFYSQSAIGMGRTELTGGTWVKDSYIGVTGKSNGDGNATANVEGDTNDAYMTYRGIENFFGNVWKWIDGFNINDGIPYVHNTDMEFADDTDTNYTRLEDTGGAGITLPQGVNDYQKTLEQIDRGFLPASLGGSSSTYITDYYYQAAGWRVADFGGDAAHGAHAGVVAWHLSHSSAGDSTYVGGRLCF